MLEKSDLYNDCSACGGKGRMGPLLSPGQGVCSVCAGRGLVMTESGQIIFDMIKLFQRDVNLNP